MDYYREYEMKKIGRDARFILVARLLFFNFLTCTDLCNESDSALTAAWIVSKQDAFFDVKFFSIHDCANTNQNMPPSLIISNTGRY